MMLHFGAYQAEVFRSAISSIPKATREAAVALGMLRFTRFRRITLPLGFRISVPPTSNNLIDLFRGTSVVALVAVQDVVFKGTIMLQTYKGDSPTIFLIIALLFLAYGYPLLLITKALERRFGST
jgi:ABC-type amino acid transport system permease subunit